MLTRACYHCKDEQSTDRQAGQAEVYQLDQVDDRRVWQSGSTGLSGAQYRRGQFPRTLTRSMECELTRTCPCDLVLGLLVPQPTKPTSTRSRWIRDQAEGRPTRRSPRHPPPGSIPGPLQGPLPALRTHRHGRRIPGRDPVQRVEAGQDRRRTGSGRRDQAVGGGGFGKVDGQGTVVAVCRAAGSRQSTLDASGSGRPDLPAGVSL